MSYSWVDPHFASLYARREEQRFTEKLLAEARARDERLPELGEIVWRRSGWLEGRLPIEQNVRLT